jgi:exoribonuclease R
MKYKIKIEDRNYRSYNLYDGEILSTEKIENPATHKLFNDDVFEINQDIQIIQSPLRSMRNIPGILVLDTSKTYGKYKNKFYYKIIPDDLRIPEFLVPYKLRITFEKKQFNKYVLFKFNHWKYKHPVAQIEQILGNVNILENYYEYKLYCKKLNASNKVFTKNTLRKLKEDGNIKKKICLKYDPEDRRNWRVYTIDPKNSKDFDDAFSIKKEKEKTFLSIYISNVSFWLESMELWDSFSQRISTIYLPNTKIPMLPTILSDNICSLQEEEERFAFTLDILFINDVMIKYEFKNTYIKVVKNYRYETPALLANKDYQNLYSFIKTINKKNKYVEEINTSHDVIQYMMIYMNYISSKKMADFEIGIFRSAELKEFKCPKVSKKIGKFLKNWNSYGGKYTKYENQKSHEILELDSYVHITSPIRRLVDLLNMIVLQNSLGLMDYSEKSKSFYTNWLSKIDYINETMKAIRKVQNNCELLRICVEENSDMKKIYDGFIFEKIKIDKSFQYTIYLPRIKMVHRIKSIRDIENLTNQTFKLFIFTNETDLKKKVRVELNF